MERLGLKGGLRYERDNKRTRRLLVALVLALSAAWLIALWAIPAAYAERGYPAVGGEWILIAAVAGAVYAALTPRAKARRGAAQAPPRCHSTIPRLFQGGGFKW